MDILKTIVVPIALAIFASTGFWDWLRNRKASNVLILDEIKKLKLDLQEERKERQQETVSNMRWFLLSFAQECRKGEDHDKEQWSYVLNRAREYEAYCSKHDVHNGVIEADTAYIRGLYEELSREHKIV